MGKQINLGKKIKYPITITKLLKQPGESFNKQNPIFQYTFTWLQEVGNKFGETWEEEQTTIADWDSPADGRLLHWKIQEGMVIEKDTVCMEIEESCSHSVQFAGLCAICGKDMNETSWVNEGTDADRANINMSHDNTLLSVSKEEANRAEEQLQRRLLKHRKLSLVVDLDQTIIHACIEPTVGEWQRDPKSPNYEAVKDVKAFQLSDDGPRGLTSGCWYYIKMRPGLKDFLAHIAELYELHVYTMGTRAYAQNIAKIVDPEHKLFGDRIISRDENGSLTAKSLSRLFPGDTKMVLIIDDRADVWPKNRPNLIKVVPYDFFVGIGDINSSFLPKRQEVPKSSPIKLLLPDKVAEKDKDGASPGTITASEPQISPDAETDPSREQAQEEASLSDNETRTSALEELVSMGGGDDPTLRKIQAEEQEEFLEKQIKDRPLLHMQQELEKEDGDPLTQGSSDGDGDGALKNGVGDGEHHQRHHLLKDDDKELSYLENHLKLVHKSFYDEYDQSRAGVLGGRVADLRPGSSKKVSMKEEWADLKIVPDVGEVMPRLKSKALTGVVIVLSGLIPLGVDPMRSEIVQQTLGFGAQVEFRITRKVTHVVVSANRTRTQKARQAAKYPHIKIVNQQWLLNSMSKWETENETPYLIQIHRDDKSLDSAAQSVNSSDEDSEADTASDEDDDEYKRGTDEDQDPDGVVPDDLDDLKSPIDGLNEFDWSGADAELDEFLASGTDEDDSDTGSVTSHASDRSQRSNHSIRGKKHPRGETDDEETDEESGLAKKQRIARVRTTGLKTVKTPNSAKSDAGLPTPEITGVEELLDDHQLPNNEDDGDIDEDEFEAQMMKEFAKEDMGPEPQDDDEGYGDEDGEGGG